MDDIFVKIMCLIEKETNMPLMEKDIEKWLEESNTNESIYEIYKLASQAREI